MEPATPPPGAPRMASGGFQAPPLWGTVSSRPSRDAKCGKIQCQGGASRPVIGTNAVSIETNIPLQEGGRILCRGTHVYLGDDMPDPGLVLAGTKCADGKVRPQSASLTRSVGLERHPLGGTLSKNTVRRSVWFPKPLLLRTLSLESGSLPLEEKVSKSQRLGLHFSLDR